MTEQVYCWEQLHTQNLAMISSYHLVMRALLREILVDAPIEVFNSNLVVLKHSTDGFSGRVQMLINERKEEFPHVGIETYSDLLVDCKFCGKHLGWKCPDNPNGYCECDYDCDNSYGPVCIHCGNPEERK